MAPFKGPRLASWVNGLLFPGHYVEQLTSPDILPMILAQHSLIVRSQQNINNLVTILSQEVKKCLPVGLGWKLEVEGMPGCKPGGDPNPPVRNCSCMKGPLGMGGGLFPPPGL